jgi:hypothetical protein
MLSRREVMSNGLLLSTVSGFVPGIATARPVPAEAWIVDRQMDAASEFLFAAESGTAEVFAFSSDPGAVWMNLLEPRLKDGPFAIGGYTSASVLFCLHYLARDYGLSLAGLDEGMNPPTAVASSSDALIDLRDPRFGDRRAAYTWLMLPRRV